MKILKVGIAGFGVVGKKRFEFINKHPQMEVIAVCDEVFSENLPIQSNEVEYFSNFRSLLNLKLDVLFVCLPNYLAAEVTVSGLENGFHVFCEKPPGKDVSDIERVIAAEKKFPSLKLKYGFNHRYHDSVREALRLIQSGTLGEIVNIRGVYGKSKIIPFSGGWRSKRELSGGGILLDQGIHMVDLMRLFCGEFIEVKSFVSNGFWNHDVEDNAYALMKTSRGVVGMLNSSATQWQHKFDLDISLTEGYIELHGILSGSKSYGEERIVVGLRNEDSDNGQMESRTIKFLNDNSWRDEVYEFADSILNDKPILFGNSYDALETMRLVYSIYAQDEGWREKFLL